MPLVGEPNFEIWLKRRAERDLLFERESEGVSACQGCGDGSGSLVLLHGRCVVCLAQEFGWDQAIAAATIADTVRVELAKVPYLSAGLLQAVTEAALERESATPDRSPQGDLAG